MKYRGKRSRRRRVSWLKRELLEIKRQKNILLIIIIILPIVMFFTLPVVFDGFDDISLIVGNIFGFIYAIIDALLGLFTN